MSAAASLRFAAELSPDAVRSWPDSAPATASTAATHASSPRSTPMLAHSSSAVAGLSLDANDRDAAAEPKTAIPGLPAPSALRNLVPPTAAPPGGRARGQTGESRGRQGRPGAARARP